ncbi:carboxypeptidase-like regulatory domain-containing protein [Clostridium sp. AWRP]|uniref:carboxypeptidase-like regulatory domain-containing protein n=1 Tax=Clostridium sp. AWRP TaxID=2212991 RepID=UPI000FD78C08|nr:carboxypeptidase-like regulatory domain-containing protein [Clostridium sp. AWRP]AZV56616.1 carboxypeptidase regulatory-like domain-containing protein [Clostridium sp. AWRP]
MAFKDLYVIGRSPQFAITGREEISENLDLTESPTASSGILKGTVTSDGVPIANATVKVFDINDNPIEHTNTGSNGQYTIANLPIGSYKVTAIAPGYLLPNTIPITIQNNKTTTANIALTADPDANLSVIYGIIRTVNGEVPIQNANVLLYSETLPEPTLISTGTTNDNGQYILGLIPTGDYHLLVSKLGFFPTQTATINVGTKELINSDVSLVPDAEANTGTVSGFIKDISTGLPIANAGIALYSIVGGVETIIATTRSTITGRYLFTNINPGNYLVKSTKQEEVS